jgi:hypothetical protein
MGWNLTAELAKNWVENWCAFSLLDLLNYLSMKGIKNGEIAIPSPRKGLTSKFGLESLACWQQSAKIPTREIYTDVWIGRSWTFRDIKA